MLGDPLKCQKCGEVIESTSENALVVCASCGELHTSTDIADIPVSLIPSQSSEAIVDGVKRHLAESHHMKGESITVESVEGIYLPILLTRTTIKGTWNGYYGSPNFNSGGGGEPGPEVSKTWNSGSIDETTDYLLIATTLGTNFGMELIHRTLFDQQPVDLSDVD